MQMKIFVCSHMFYDDVLMNIFKKLSLNVTKLFAKQIKHVFSRRNRRICWSLNDKVMKLKQIGDILYNCHAIIMALGKSCLHTI